MTIVLPTHPGVRLTDPQVTIMATIDRPHEQTYQPSVLLSVQPNIAIHYELPPQPYVDGSWTDADVQHAVQDHLAILTD